MFLLDIDLSDECDGSINVNENCTIDGRGV